MARYFESISEEDLYKKVHAAYMKGSLPAAVYKDLSKVKSNSLLYHFTRIPLAYKLQKLVGPYTIASTGLTFVGCLSIGDNAKEEKWDGMANPPIAEVPYFFIVYWDGKSLRGYIPEAGNTFDKKTMSAMEASKLSLALETASHDLVLTELKTHLVRRPTLAELIVAGQPGMETEAKPKIPKASKKELAARFDLDFE